MTLRINIQAPHSHRILIVWKRLESPPIQAAQSERSSGITEIQNLMVGILQCVNDRWFTIIDANQGFFNLSGYSRTDLNDELQGHYLNIIHPDDRAEVIARFHEKLLLGIPIELEYPAQKGLADGHLGYCLKMGIV